MKLRHPFRQRLIFGHALFGNAFADVFGFHVCSLIAVVFSDGERQVERPFSPSQRKAGSILCHVVPVRGFRPWRRRRLCVLREMAHDFLAESDFPDEHADALFVRHRALLRLRNASGVLLMAGVWERERNQSAGFS